MAKMRVSELAKELNINSKDIITYLNGFGLEIKSHSSNLDEKQISMIRGSVSINGGKLDVGANTDSGKKSDAEKKPAKKAEAKPATEKKPVEKAAEAEKKAEKAPEKKDAAPEPKKEEPARINILGNVYAQQAERQAAKAAQAAQNGQRQGDRPQGDRRYGDRPQGQRPQGGMGNRPQNGGFNKDRFFDKDADKDAVQQKRPAARGRNDGRSGADPCPAYPFP